MLFKTSFWIRFSIFNLLLVALLGLLMRYKIGFEFPLLDQKSLQHSHSHFAFAGWVSHTLMTLLISFLQKYDLKNKIIFKKYNSILIGNLICSYVMLFSFIIQGYGTVSITFSTLSIFVSYWFAYVFFKDCKQIETESIAVKWFKAALFFNVISSLGTFALAFMMATKNIHQNEYLASIYYYLHFQYNGWFWFACMGLFVSQLIPNLTIEKTNKTVFKWFFISCIPAYLLSILWLKLPIWIYIIAVFCSLLQIGAWVKFLKSSISSFLKNYPVAPFFKWIYISIIVCVSIKFFLQLGSTVPLIGKLAFGFRPIVIAYLHLVLLAIISGFLLVYIFTNRLVIQNNTIKKALAVFIIGIFLNELVLAVQGVASFSYTLIPYINEMLFGIAILLFFGAFRMFYLNVNNG